MNNSTNLIAFSLKLMNLKRFQPIWKNIQSTYILFVACASSTALNSQCPTGDVYLTSQFQVDSFVDLHSSCTTINGNLAIGLDPNGNNGYWWEINDLSGLSSIENVIGDLTISTIDSLFDLNGLQNITNVHGNLNIYNNSSIIDLSGLESLSRVDGSFTIQDNDNLIDFNGLNYLDSIGGGMYIMGNVDSLFSFNGFSALKYIGGELRVQWNAHLRNFNGLDSLSYVGNSLSISGNSELLSLNGLERLEHINYGLTITYCPLLNSLLALQGVETILDSGSISISGNDILTNLIGIDNIDLSNISFLHIFDCPNLYICNTQNVCSYLSDSEHLSYISGNANGCQSSQQIVLSCPIDSIIVEGKVFNRNYNISTGQFTNTLVPFGSTDTLEIYFSAPDEDPPVVTYSDIVGDWEYNIMDSFVEPLSYRLDYPVSDFHQSLFKNNIYLSGQQDFTIHKNLYTTLANLINENIDHSYELWVNDTSHIQAWLENASNTFATEDLADAMARMLIQNFAINEYHTDTLFNTYLHNFAEYSAKLFSNLVNVKNYAGIHAKNLNGEHTLEADEIIGKIISKSLDLIVKVAGADKKTQVVESLASNLVASDISEYNLAKTMSNFKKKFKEKLLEGGFYLAVDYIVNAVLKVQIQEDREDRANDVTGFTNTVEVPQGILPLDSVFVKTIDLNSGSDSHLYSDRNEMEYINNLYQATTSITEGVDYVADILEATPGVTSLAVYFRGFNFVAHAATVGRFLGGLWHIYESNAAIPSIIYQDPESNQQGLQMGPITRTQLMMPDSCWASIVSDHAVSLDSLHTYAENLDTTRLLNYIPQFLESDAVFEREALNCYYPLLLDCLDVNGDTNILNIVCNLKNKLDLMDLRRFDIYTWLGMVFTSDSFNFEIIRLHIDTLYAEMDSVSLRIDTLRTSLEEYEILNGNFPNISSLHIVNKEIVRLNEYDVDVRLVITNIGDIMSDSSLIYVSADTLGMPLTDTARTIIPIAPFDTVALNWTFAFPSLDSAEIITFMLNFVDSVTLTYSDFISYRHKKLYYHYYDLDTDGYGRPDSVWLINIDTTLTGFVLLSGDCDDTNPAINPGAVDIPCNEIDENCDGRDGLVRLWVGGTGMWSDSSGWSPFGIPGVCDEAQILVSTDSVMIPVDYSAIAGRVLISDGAVLQLLDSSFLDLNDPDDAAALELLDGAFLENRGTIRIGNLDTIPAGGIRVATSADIYNDSSGVIQVNAIYGLDHDAIVIEGSNSHLNNQGLIEIGGFTQIAGYGIRVSGNGTLANGFSGLIEIDSITGAGKDGITIEQNGHLINEGDLRMGSNSPVNRYGISLTTLGDLMNHPSGTISIDQVQSALYAFGTGVLAKNEGEIRIGSIATVSANGILLSGLAEMINDSSAEVFIDQCLHAVSIDNQAKLTNNAGIHIGSLLPITGNGISLASGGDMVNLDSANVEINRTNQAIFATAFGSTLANEGIFRIGNIASSNNGISLASSASLNNQLTGMIEIDAISINHGIQVSLSATFNNAGLIRIGTSTAINKFGISLATSGDFNNNAPGLIEINNCLDIGINMTNSGSTFINGATIHLGNLSAITNTGLSLTGSAVFGNAATGLLSINRTTGYAAMVNNNLAVFNNFGTVRLGDLAPIGGGMIMWASGKFTNFANSHLEINRASWVGCLVDQSGTLFTNHGNFKIGNLDITQAGIHHKNGGDFINQSTGSIEIDRISDFGLQSSNAGSVFTNNGMITIGSNGTVSNSGIFVNQSASFSNSSLGSIQINNANVNWWTKAIAVSGATFANTGLIVMGNLFQNSGGISIESAGTFTNNASGIVQAHHTFYNGIQVVHSGSVCTNHGSILMGTIGSLGYNGILAEQSASFTNSISGSIEINNVNPNWWSRGIMLSASGAFSNAGSIQLGNLLSNTTGIFVDGSGGFTNTSDGTITINNTTNNGVLVEVAGSSFLNNGDLLIGTAGSSMENGILVQNNSTFSNGATGLIRINKANAQWWSKSVAVISATFTNSGSIEAGNSSLNSYGLHVESTGSFTNQVSGTIRVNTTTYNGIQLVHPSTMFTNNGFIEIGDSSQIGYNGIGIYENSSMSNSATGTIELNQGTTNWFSGALFVHTGSFTNFGTIASGAFSNVNFGLLIGNSTTETGTFVNHGNIEIDRIPPTTSYAAITVRPGSSFSNEITGVLKIGLNHNVQYGLYGGGTISNYGLLQARHVIYGTVDYAQTLTNYSGGVIEVLAPGTLLIETAGTLHNHADALLKSQSGAFLRIKGVVNNYGLIDAQ